MAANKCRAVLHMDDPWYMVFCCRPLGHPGKHRAEWTDQTEGAKPHSRPRKKQEVPDGR